MAIGALVVASKGEQEDQMPQDIYCGDMNCYEVLIGFISTVFFLSWAKPQYIISGAWSRQGESEERHFQGLPETGWKMAS